MSRKIVKWMINISGAVLVGSAILAIRKENTVSRAHKVRQQNLINIIDSNADTAQTFNSQKIKDSFYKNHVGRKLASMMRTQEFYAHQIEKKLREKEETLSNLTEDQKDKMEELKDEIEQLNRVYVAVKPKKITSWDDLREKEEEEEGY